MQNGDLRAWVVTADMGLGHQRATDPFRDIAEEGLLVAGSPGISDPSEQRLWNRTRNSYEFLSRTRDVPLIGRPLFGLLDELQRISPFYPRRDLSSPTYQVKLASSLIRRGLGRELVRKLRQKPLPMITSFMAPALAADRAGVSPVYCIICDAEVSRAWVPEHPAASGIRYLVPCGRALMRLRSYGVPDERIFLTGFPMPLELLGDRTLDVLRADTAARLRRLDPANRFHPLHGLNVAHFLGAENMRPGPAEALTITYAVGGAGAQRDTGMHIARSLRPLIRSGAIRLNLVAGIRADVKRYFDRIQRELFPDGPGPQVLYHPDPARYFRLFAQTIRTTDILWTKPSELSFYCGLGLPVIMTPPIGAQEQYNRKWLLEIQAGIPQEDPRYTDQWLTDLLTAGRLAEAAWDGFLKARKYGTYKIFDLLQTGTMDRDPSPLRR